MPCELERLLLIVLVNFPAIGSWMAATPESKDTLPRLPKIVAITRLSEFTVEELPRSSALLFCRHCTGRQRSKSWLDLNFLIATRLTLRLRAQWNRNNAQPCDVFRMQNAYVATTDAGLLSKIRNPGSQVSPKRGSIITVVLIQRLAVSRRALDVVCFERRHVVRMVNTSTAKFTMRTNPTGPA